MTSTQPNTTAQPSIRPLVDWTFRAVGSVAEPSAIRLPHDAMLTASRGDSAPGGADTAWFAGGDYEYRTVWTSEASDAGADIALRFEGVQGDAEVFIDGDRLGTVRGGYFEHEFPLNDYVSGSADHELLVVVSHSSQPSERWYPGSGLYRPVQVITRPRIRIARDGIRLRTRSLTNLRADVDIDLQVHNPPAGVSVSVTLRADEDPVATGLLDAAHGSVALRVPRPRAWSDEDPFLYELGVEVLLDGEVIASQTEKVGLRTIAVDAKAGLRINGRVVNLRGACIHHDNGLLGATTHRAAEFRRIRLLKEAGFNAIRSAHNPMGQHLLDACDELGMYVLDEFADYWYVRKTAHDHSERFLENWREDADTLITKDRNRPSVIMYAIGNEIPETATPQGVALAHEISDYFRSSDPDRPTTVAINLFLNAMVSLNASPYQERDAEQSMAGSTEANVMVNHIGKLMHLVARLPMADKASRDAFSAVDVAGYNYGLARYRTDIRKYPNRVILGSETLPGDVAWAWQQVLKYPAVIGDFVWTGWEYLGEAGVAVWVPGKRAGLSKPYPYIISGPGMFDLTGRPDVSLRLAQAAWGFLDRPALAVRPLDRSGVPYVRSAWRVTDAVESWSWRGSEGKTAEIEVYSTDDEVELLLNGRLVGRKAAGQRAKFLTRFKVPYESGVLEAIGYRAGKAVSRTQLRSARNDLTLVAVPENEILVGDGDDLAFVHLSLADANGEIEMLAGDQVSVEVEGPAELIGFGTAAPSTEESFLTATASTYRGRALAVVRSTGGTGTVTITARSLAHGTASIELTAVAAKNVVAVSGPLEALPRT